MLRAATCLSKTHAPVFLSNRKLKVLGVSLDFHNTTFPCCSERSQEDVSKSYWVRFLGMLFEAGWLSWEACPIAPFLLTAAWNLNVMSGATVTILGSWGDLKDTVLVLMMAESRIEETVRDGLQSCYINPGLASSRFLFTCKKSLISFLFKLL